MKIDFLYKDIVFKETLLSPIPAIKNAPDWYKKMNVTLKSTSECPFKFVLYPNHIGVNTTVKNCVPFRDALLFGYQAIAEADLQFRLLKDSTIEFNYRSASQNFKLMSAHDIEQVPGLPPLNPKSKYPLVFKFLTNFIIRTPKGYSTLFTHPLNRYELPFLTYSGIVDTDIYKLEINLPFQLNYNFKDHNDVLIVPAGTPLCTFIPFKRDNWNSTKKLQKIEEGVKNSFRYFRKIVDAYKTQIWVKKTFK